MVPNSAAMAMINLEIIRGLWVQARYGNRDADRHAKADYRDQVMGGIFFYPMPFVSTTFEYIHNWQKARPNNDIVTAQAHFWF